MSHRAHTSTRGLAAAALAVAVAAPVTAPVVAPVVLAPAAGAVVASQETQPAATARGDVTFDCILQPFRSAFRYQGRASISGQPGAEAGAMELTASFPDLPGIAPVPIDGGTMHVSVKGTMGGEPLELTSTSTVNAEPKAEVPLPQLSGVVQADPADAAVELTTFRFAFEEMMGIEISADCEATDGAHLGRMRAGAGGPEETAADDAAEGTEGTAGTAAVAESGPSLPLLALWALPVGVVALGLVLWLPKRLRRS